MYEDNSKNVSIKGIVVKILLIILVICVLMWIFPTKKDLENNLSNINYNSGTNVNIDPLLNTIFGQNIQIMKNAGRAYYYSATLPKNVGDSSNITLQELINKKMLVEFKDKNGNSCDTTASYVQLTKTGTNKYEMKTYLKCNGEENYIIDNLGCTDLCPNACTNTSNNTTNNSTNNNVKDDKDDEKDTGSGNNNTTNNKTFRYLYSCKNTTTSWSGWSDWSTSYVSETSNRQVQTKTETTKKYVSTGTTTTCESKTETVRYTTPPSDMTGCVIIKRSSSTGFYNEYKCTRTTCTPVTKEEYAWRDVTKTLYRYKTKTTSSNTYTKWSYSANDSSLKGCTIIKSELVTTK